MQEHLAPSAPAAPVTAGGVRPRAARGRARGSAGPAAVAVAFVLAQLALVVPGSGLGWDEAVYVSQVSAEVPAAYFSAPRARGISFLAAPVAAVTTSVTALRVWLAVASGAGLFLALRAWRPLLPARVLTLAGALFAGLWITLYYGARAMPNLWSALAALAAVGCFLRCARGTARRCRVGLAASVAVVALMRPPDALWLALALTVAAPVLGRRERAVLPVLAWTAAGAVLGGAEWIVEAYLCYGGLRARLERADAIQGGLGWHPAVDAHVRALAGRTLCRPCDVPWRHPVTAAWWAALPLLAAGGVAVARHRRAAAVVATAVAVCTAAPYLVLVDYAAPRFLLPAYALLALPVAECLLWLATAPRCRPLITVALALALAAHLAVQYAVLTRTVARSHQSRTAFEGAAARLHRLGVRPPCVISGELAVQLAYYTGCSSRQTAGPDASLTPGALRALAAHRPVAVVVAPGRPPPPHARDWHPEPLPGGAPLTGFSVYVAGQVSGKR
ncbi:hypothetical protein AB0K09_08135 [Streptomyces sp. NPDC049577]|uniref:hypothetical protein n=1 Tax=Streptomyces sp. NPDC049577 TaxID=3155153 RepID=UPI00341EB9B3